MQGIGYDHAIGSYDHVVAADLGPGSTGGVQHALPGPIPRITDVLDDDAEGTGTPSASDQAYGAAPGPRTLRSGARGADVETLQAQLNARGETLAVDGIFGPETKAAVRRFQAASGLTVDGVVGPHTRSALEASPSAGPERVLQTLDRNGDTAPVGGSSPTGNLLGTPGKSGGKVGATPGQFERAIDSKMPNAESAAELGQRLWWTSIGKAIASEVASIVSGAGKAGVFVGNDVPGMFALLLDAVEALDLSLAKTLSGAVTKALRAAGTSSHIDRLIDLAELGSVSEKRGAQIFHALWNGYDKTRAPFAVPAKYRNVGSALSVHMYEKHECAQVAGIGARRYYKANPPRGSASFQNATFASSAVRNTEVHGQPPHMRGDVLSYSDPTSHRDAMLDTLDAGYLLLAQVVSGSCVGPESAVWGHKPVKHQQVTPKTEHWLLIIGWDGSAFDYWNPSGAGGAFGKLYMRSNSFSTAKDDADLDVVEGGTHTSYGRQRYQVVSVGVQPVSSQGKGSPKTASTAGFAADEDVDALA